MGNLIRLFSISFITCPQFHSILYLQISLDKVVGYGASATLNVLTVGVIALLIMNSLMTVGRDYAIRFIGQAIEARLLTDAFEILKLPAGTIYGSSSISPESVLLEAARYESSSRSV